MVSTANAKLRDATEQLGEVLMHKLRSEARIEAMDKRLAVVKQHRQKHQEGERAVELFYHTHSTCRWALSKFLQPFVKTAHVGEIMVRAHGLQNNTQCLCRPRNTVTFRRPQLHPRFSSPPVPVASTNLLAHPLPRNRPPLGGCNSV